MPKSVGKIVNQESMRSQEEEEAAEMARLEKTLSHKGMGGKVPVKVNTVVSPRNNVEADALKKSGSGPISPRPGMDSKVILYFVHTFERFCLSYLSFFPLFCFSYFFSGMPAWKLKELEKERERKQKQEEEEKKKGLTAEAIKNRQLEFGVDSAYMTLRPGMKFDTV